MIAIQLQEAKQLKEKGELEKAIAKYSDILKLNPNCVEAHLELADLYESIQKTELAITHYRKASAIEPKNMVALGRLGNLFLKQGNLVEAIKSLKVAVTELRDKPKWAQKWLYGLWADALANQGELDQAISAYQKIIDLDDQIDIIHIRIASLAKKKGYFLQAIENYEKALALKLEQPAWVYTHLGEVYEQIGNREAAIAIYQKGIEMVSEPENSRLYVQYGIVMIKQGNEIAAIEAYQEAIKLTQEQPLWVYAGLGKLLRNNGREEEAIAISEKLIQLKPNEFHGYLALAENLGKYADKLDQVIDNYQKAITLKPDLPFSVYQQLAIALKQSGKEAEAEACIKSIPVPQNGDKYLKIWQSLNSITREILEQDNSNELEGTDNKALLQAYFDQNSSYKIINLKSLTEEDEKYLANVGISLDYLKLNQELITKEGVIPTNSPIDFQMSLVKEGLVYAICPFTGKILASNRSLPLIGLNSCYRFVSEQVFYLIPELSASYYSTKAALYFPNSEIIVNFTNCLEPIKPEQINVWKGDLVFDWKQIKFYLRNKDQVKTVVILLLNHVAHHLWNDLTGIYDLYEANCLDKIDKFFLYTTEFYGNLEEIFPEIPTHKIQRLDQRLIRQEITQNNYFVIHLKNKYIKEDLANRIYQVSLKKCSSDCLAEIEEAKRKHFPLLLVSIRLGNRTWINQLEGTANIINSLYAKFPKLGVVFDGISPPLNNFIVGTVNENPEPSIKKEKEFVEKIKSLIPEITIYDTIGCWMPESIVWTNAIDLYLSPFGGSMVKTTWLANKPGVVHSNTSETKRPNSSYGAWRDNAINPVYIPFTHIVDITEGFTKYAIGDPRKSNFLYNYDCDWRIIYEEVLKLILSIEKLRSIQEQSSDKTLIDQ